jgi:hypothetical protein
VSEQPTKDAMFIAIQLRAKQEAEVLYDFVQCAADRDWLIAEVKRLREYEWMYKDLQK